MAVLFAFASAAVENTWEYSVQVSATIQTSPPQITLTWPQDVNGTPVSYTVYRKLKDASGWGAGVTLPGTTTSYVDSNVTVGSAYEYQIHKWRPPNNSYGYIYAGIDAPLLENRGKLVLLVDDSFSTPLASELTRLQQDLVGDGWTVLRHDVSRNNSVANVKAVIKSDYDADPANVKCVFLLGRIPVPYAGNIAPDSHLEHTGAWPADVFYAELNGAWTDSTVNNATAEDSRNWNVPGDGKFDQSYPPSPVELQIGRVDFANMPGRKTWNGPPTFPSELELLRNYLNKDHNFRHKRYTAERRGFIFNGVGDRYGYAFAATAWRNFAPFFGASQIRLANDNEFIPVLHTNSYLWSYACSGGDDKSIAYLGGSGNYNGGTATDFVEQDLKTVFVMLLGSHLGDWDSEDNIMRSVLAMPSFGLTCCYGGAPHWFFHHMALGETIGYGAMLTQNNPTNGLYRNATNWAAGQVHIAIMGDPTLRLHAVAPPSNLSVLSDAAGVRLSWIGAPDSVVGYHVYRAPISTGPFTRLTSLPVSGTSYTDTSGQGGTYMVRSIKREISASGTYLNPSQGIFISASAPPQEFKILSLREQGGSVTISWASVAGKNYRVVAKIDLTASQWTDLSGDIQANANVTSWSSGMPGVAQFYRIQTAP